MAEYDKDKIIDCMFDSDVSEILAELEDGSKESSHLEKKFGISEEQLRERLAYLLEHEFVKQTLQDGNIVYTADGKKFAEVIENDSFDTAVDGLTKMDSYLN